MPAKESQPNIGVRTARQRIPRIEDSRAKPNQRRSIECRWIKESGTKESQPDQRKQIARTTRASPAKRTTPMPRQSSPAEERELENGPGRRELAPAK